MAKTFAFWRIPPDGAKKTALRDYTDCMGVVTDTTFIFCYWPPLDTPTELFADGSAKLRVMGNTPRNVVFPEDTEFLAYYPDALYPAELAAKAAGAPAMVNLSDAHYAAWQAAYDAAVATFPPTHTILQTPSESVFNRERKREDRLVEIEVTENLLIDGQVKPATFKREVMRPEDVVVVTELTMVEARQIASAKKVRGR